VKRALRPLSAWLFSPYPEERPVGENPRRSFSWRKFSRHYLKAVGWIVFLIVVVHFMEASGVLKGFETAGLDTFLRLHSRKMSERVVVVEITDQDYESPDLFGGKSPLKSELLAELVSSIRKYDPAVIAMDFDTRSKDWCQLGPALLAEMLPEKSNAQGTPSHPPVIWAEVPSNIEEPLRLTPVLGGMLGDSRYVGVPRFPVDSDGLVRRYEEEFSVAGLLGDCSSQPAQPADIPGGEQHLSATTTRDVVPSFAKAILDHACDRRGVDCSSLRQERHEPVIFNFYGDRYRFPIIQSHEFIGPAAQSLAMNNDLQAQRSDLFRHKIVLIGGNFSAARDIYMTPLGPMAGVELIALAIESDFSGGIRETRKWLEKLADFVVGSLIVFLYFYYRRRPRVAFFASLIGIPLLAALFSWLLFQSVDYWFNFMPIIIGMVLHQMLELSESCGELQKEVERLESRALLSRQEKVEASLADPTSPEP
jgi:CHASE2 domain-containing sensor protein